MNKLYSIEEIDNMSIEELEAFIESETGYIHQLNCRQLGQKLTNNSGYGFLSTVYSRLYDVRLAEAITLTGQTVTAESFKMFNDYLNKVIPESKEHDYIAFSDTDSAAVDFTDFVNDIIGSENPFETKLNKLTKLADDFFGNMLDETFERFAVELNSIENKIVMKREKIAKAIIVAKKNYVVDVYDNEGVRYAEPKMSITGLEAIKALIPESFRHGLLKGYKICLTGTEKEFQKFVSDMFNGLESIPLDELYGNTTVNNIEQYCDSLGKPIKGCPGHVKGALAYNRLVKGSDKYAPIRSGEKVNTVNLKQPNPLQSDNLAFPDNYPSDLISEEYIDRESLYEKYFLKPIKRVSDIVNFATEKKQSLGLF